MMKNKFFGVAAVVSTLILSAPKDANAFFIPLLSIDFSVITTKINQIKDDIMGLKVVKDTMSTVSTISNTIGDAKATISKFTDQAKDAIEEGKRLKKMAEDYKKQFDEYKAYAEKTAETAKKQAENLKNADKLAKGMIESKTGSISGMVDNAKSKVGMDAEDRNGIDQEDELSSENKIYNPEDALVKENGTKEQEGRENLMPLKDDEVGVKELEKMSSDTNDGKFRALNAKLDALGNKPMAVDKGAVKAEPKGTEIKALPQGDKMSAVSKAAAAPAKALSAAPAKALSAAPAKAPVAPAKALSAAPKDAKPAAASPAPEKKGFRNVQKLNLSSLGTTSFFYERHQQLSFADATDMGGLSTGKTKGGAYILPKEMAMFCDISVNALKSDVDKLESCLKQFSAMKNSNDTEEFEASLDNIMKVRRQNAAGSLGDSMSITNKAAVSAAEQTQDILEKTENVETVRDLEQTVPNMSIIIAQVFANYMFFRAAEGAYEIFDKVDNLKVEHE